MDRDLLPEEFQRFHDLIYRTAGIHYPAEKVSLLSNRIRKRLHATRTRSYSDYLALLQSGRSGAELQAFLDSVTTNETYFFRCQRHWAFFREWAQQRAQDPAARREGFRIWSAAASNGAEAYTIAIVLHQVLGPDFGGSRVEVLGTDLSAQVLDEARAARYRPYATAQTPPPVLQQYFTKAASDQLQFDPRLAKVVRFQRHNLMDPLAAAPFDFVFLRNVMIYFDGPSKQRVLRHAFEVTKPGAYLVVGESESLMNVEQPFVYRKPSIFQKPARAAEPAGQARR